MRPISSNKNGTATAALSARIELGTGTPPDKKCGEHSERKVVKNETGKTGKSDPTDSTKATKVSSQLRPRESLSSLNGKCNNFQNGSPRTFPRVISNQADDGGDAAGGSSNSSGKSTWTISISDIELFLLSSHAFF